MNPSAFPAAKLLECERKNLAIRALAGSATISDLAAQHGVSRKFVYQQTHRQDLFDFIVAELGRREHEDPRRIRPALQNQRDDLLAFAGVLDDKLTGIAQAHELPEHLVRAACVLHRKPSTSPAYW